MTTDSVMFIGWNRPIAGRDQQALQLFERSLGYYGSLVADKKLASFEPVLLSAHGGDLNGFVLLRGTPDQIGAVQRDDKFTELITEAQFCVDRVGVVHGHTGAGTQPMLQRWAKHAGKK